MVCLFVSLKGGAVCVWGRRWLQLGGGAPAITSVDRLLSVFTQTRGVSHGVNILITAPTSWVVSEAEVPESSRLGGAGGGGREGRWG